MLVGTADVESLAARAPTIARWGAGPLALADVSVLQAHYEMTVAAREAVLPAGLHPTNPALLGWLVYRVGSSPLGPFSLAQARIECRSGVRLRGFLAGAIADSSEVAEALASGWGFACRAGEVELRREGDAATAVVHVDGRTILDLRVEDLVPLAPGDVQYVAGMHLARTPIGLRLLQVEPRYEVQSAERGRPRLERFDAAAWGDARLDPAHPVSASLAAAAMTLPPVRFACRPDVLAFEGTESVGGDVPA
jgi:hypothetical protein